MPAIGEPAPVSTATMPPRRYIEETERSNSPAMIVMPSASATRPYEEKFWKMSYTFAVRTVYSVNTGSSANVTIISARIAKGANRLARHACAPVGSSRRSLIGFAP